MSDLTKSETSEGTAGMPVARGDLAARARGFIREVVIPAEADARADDPARHAGLCDELRAAARAAGLFAPGVPRAWGGLGLSMLEQSAVLEEAGYSLLGPSALNCAAPDEGNMHLLALVAGDEQKRRYLAPLAAGSMRSAFAMTEPPPGAGSDPSMIRTTARRTADGWVLEGRKRFVTGAVGAGLVICMARTGDEVSHDRGATMFLVDSGTPGMRIERTIPTLDRTFSGGHAEITFEGCALPDDAVLGEPERGYAYAQARLAPARLTHCMRWLGLARRALDVALDYSAAREAFGARLDELGLAQGLIADSVIDLEASRALIARTAERLDRGERALHESSIAKVFVSEAVGRVVDRSVQLCGGLGVSADLPLARFLDEVRPFRIYDGPSEVHRWSIARRAARRRAGERDA